MACSSCARYAVFQPVASAERGACAPSPQSLAATVQMVDSNERDMMLCSRCGTVRYAPTNEKSESEKFQSASASTSLNGLRSRMTRWPPKTSARYATQMRLGVHGCALTHVMPGPARKFFS